jgi:hypothetical protein
MSRPYATSECSFRVRDLRPAPKSQRPLILFVRHRPGSLLFSLFFGGTGHSANETRAISFRFRKIWQVEMELPPQPKSSPPFPTHIRPCHTCRLRLMPMPTHLRSPPHVFRCLTGLGWSYWMPPSAEIGRQPEMGESAFWHGLHMFSAPLNSSSMLVLCVPCFQHL